MFNFQCATLTIAFDGEVRFQPGHEYYHEPSNYGSHKPHHPHRSEESGDREHHGFSKPHFPHSSEGSGEWSPHGFPKPHSPHSSEESGERGHYGFPKPHFPHSSEESGEWGYHGFPKPHFSHSPEPGQGKHYGHAKPHVPNHEGLEHPDPHIAHGHHESGESNHHGQHKPHLSYSSQEQKWGHKIHHPDWHNPHFQPPMPLNQHFEEMERRRPLFFPIYPYHPFYPHGHPANNDEEFETIEALKRNNYHMSRRNFILADDSAPEVSDDQKHQKPYYHGLHNPNSDTSENAPEMPFRPFHHGFPHPHFNPFHKKPALPEENDGFAPIITEDLYVNGKNSDEPQSYGPPSSQNNEGFPGQFFIIENDKEHFKLPPIVLDILEHLHHGHGKPHHHGDNKPNEDEDENEVDEEGSGEEEIIPLFAEANAPLIQDDLSITESEN